MFESILNNIKKKKQYLIIYFYLTLFMYQMLEIYLKWFMFSFLNSHILSILNFLYCYFPKILQL